MMKRRKFGLLLGAALIVQACTNTEIATPTTISAVPAGKAVVVFYRPVKLVGAIVLLNVHHTDGPVGQLVNGGTLHKVVKPGANTFLAQAVSEDLWGQIVNEGSITIKTKAGKTYYVRSEVNMGLYRGKPQFTQVSENQARQEMAQ